MKSLDPRIVRLLRDVKSASSGTKPSLDQFSTFEVFVQPKAGKPFQHEGAVHAPNLEMAYVLAKEAFTRRFTCVSLYVVATDRVFVSPLTDGNQSVYNLISAESPTPGNDSYEVYHLMKRGKQHVHVGTVRANDPSHATAMAKQQLAVDKVVYNVWVIRTKDIRFTSAEEADLWTTLAEKRFRDAADYKGGDKLKEFLEAKR